MRATGVAIAVLAGHALGHGDHKTGSHKPQVDENASWMQKHMAGMI